jgi:hypothetical protein
MPPKISLSTAADYYRSAEARLALFVTSLQTGHRKRAAEMLSSRASEADRQALIEKRWLRRTPDARKDFNQLFYLPDIQIRTRDFQRDSAVCYILPRGKISRKSGLPTGYLPVRMVRQEGRWYVDLRPPKLMSIVR